MTTTQSDKTVESDAMTVPRVVLSAAVVLAGLSAGFFYGYETSVTLGLASVDDPTYVRTFQALNDAVRNPGFGIVFFGVVPVIIASLFLHWNAGAVRRALIVAALALHMTLIAITGIGNVPLNEELAEIGAVSGITATAARAGFEQDWNRLNRARTTAAVLSFGLLVAAGGLPTRKVALEHEVSIPGGTSDS